MDKLESQSLKLGQDLEQSPELFLQDLTSDLQAIVRDIPVDEGPSDNQKKEHKTSKKANAHLMSRSRLVEAVLKIFKKIKSFRFILSGSSFVLIEKRFNATLMLNRLGADPDNMSVSELNIVYDNFRASM